MTGRALDSVERSLLSLPPKNLGFRSNPDGAKVEIENGTHQLETLINASIDKSFDVFELYVMRNIITVDEDSQPFMTLSHYDGLDFSDMDGMSVEGINHLRRKLQASQKLHLALEAESAKNEALLQKLRTAVGVDVPVKKENEDEASQRNVLGFLHDKRTLEQGGASKPITTTTEFTLSQLQSLRDLSTSLKSLLPNLGAEEAGDDAGDEKTWRRERVEYVEGASKKLLESSGVELGPAGEVRDGEWQGAGRGLTREEVEGLEGAVSALEAQSAAPPENADEDQNMDES